MKVWSLPLLFCLIGFASGAEDERAAEFSRLLISKAEKLPEQCKRLCLEVESVKHEFTPEGQRDKVVAPVPQRLTLVIEPLMSGQRFWAQYHPQISPWVGNPNGKWLLEELTHRYDGVTMLTVHTSVGTEHKIGPKHSAMVSRPDRDVHDEIFRDAALDMILFPFCKRSNHRSPLVEQLAIKLKQPEVDNVKVNFSSGKDGEGAKLQVVLNLLRDLQYHNELDFGTPDSGVMLKRHLSFMVTGGQRVVEEEVIGSDFVPLVKGLSIPTKVKRIRYEQGKPKSETLYEIKAQIASPTDPWMDLKIPSGYWVEDHLRGVTYQKK